jgi:CheY-like chemotaxis protein
MSSRAVNYPFAASIARTRILVADADTDGRAFYRQVLERRGFDVAEAADGPGALVVALSAPVALAIIDARLPVFDGHALVDLLRNDAATRALPIVMISAGPTPTRESAFQRTLQKPIELDALISHVSALLATPPSDHASAEMQTETPWQAATARRTIKSRAHQRYVTTTPATPPPALRCRQCDQPLTYVRSFVGGVNARSREQWDEFTCPSGCATFEYRHRTKSIR